MDAPSCSFWAIQPPRPGSSNWLETAIHRLSRPQKLECCWLNGGKSDTKLQPDLLVQFRTMATADPKNDQLAYALEAAGARAQRIIEIGNAAHDIIENTLTGPAAAAYKAKPAKLGERFVVDVTTIDGKHLSTADWKGKVIVLDFWATWYGAHGRSTQSRPGLQRLARLGT